MALLGGNHIHSIDMNLLPDDDHPLCPQIHRPNLEVNKVDTTSEIGVPTVSGFEFDAIFAMVPLHLANPNQSSCRIKNPSGNGCVIFGDKPDMKSILSRTRYAIQTSSRF